MELYVRILVKRLIKYLKGKILEVGKLKFG
jgi:hypothetical protein